MGPNGYIYTELQLDSSETASIGIKGTIDVLVIDSDGKAHIFDLKISKNKYNNWDSAKILKTDWQMAFYRGLLSQYIPSYRDWETDRKSTRLNSSHSAKSRMPSSA